jgi:putative membrane protein
LLVGTLSLNASKLALQRTQNPKLKQFAQLETSEQAVADVLKAVKTAANDLTPPSQFGPELEHSQRATFNRDYAAAQIAGHQRLLKIQEDYLAVGKNLVNTSVAQLASAVIKEHLTLLRDLEGNG